MAKQTYNLHLKGYVGGWDFEADYVDYVLGKNADTEVNVLIDSLGGSLATALSIVAAFRNHGKVNVHYVGMNASAATIVSLGAAHVSIDSSAMYLVHKCSMEFFKWASANADKLRDIIREAQQMKADLDKMDSNIAQMYAKKCKKNPEDLLALMKKGGWLTAQEALEWGFVDEITDFEDDAAPVIDDRMAADMGAAGIPIPQCVEREPSGNMFSRFIDALTTAFRRSASDTTQDNNTNTKTDMNTENKTPQAQQQKTPATVQTPPVQPSAGDSPSAAETAHAAALAAKDDEIARLKAEVEALKKSPGDGTSHVVDTLPNGAPEVSAAEQEITEFHDSFARAKSLHDALPH